MPGLGTRPGSLLFVAVLAVDVYTLFRILGSRPRHRNRPRPRPVLNPFHIRPSQLSFYRQVFIRHAHTHIKLGRTENRSKMIIWRRHRLNTGNTEYRSTREAERIVQQCCAMCWFETEMGLVDELTGWEGLRERSNWFKVQWVFWIVALAYIQIYRHRITTYNEWPLRVSTCTSYERHDLARDRTSFSCINSTYSSHALLSSQRSTSLASSTSEVSSTRSVQTSGTAVVLSVQGCPPGGPT